MGPSCAAISMVKMTLADSGAPGDVMEQVEKMVGLQKQLCDAYNKLRSVAGNWEAASGVEDPTFYPGDYHETGEPVVRGGTCRCGLLPDRTAIGATVSGEAFRSYR